LRVLILCFGRKNTIPRKYDHECTSLQVAYLLRRVTHENCDASNKLIYSSKVSTCKVLNRNLFNGMKVERKFDKSQPTSIFPAFFLIGQIYLVTVHGPVNVQMQNNIRKRVRKFTKNFFKHVNEISFSAWYQQYIRQFG